MRITRVLAATVPLSLLLTGLGAGPGQAAGRPTSAPSSDPGARSPGVPSALAAQKLAWKECYPGKGAPELQCAGIRAPLDWSRPNGPRITVAVSRVKASDPANRRGVLFTNPGGPGAPGLTLSLYLARTEKKVAAVYDIIGMDPRGVGASSPRLECAPPSILGSLYDLDGRDTSAANQRRFAELNARFARACSSTPLTRYITTEQTVRDLDLIRTVLGERKVSYVGYSAGTWLGSWYAATYPSRVDRFVLDGNLDVTAPSYTSARRQPKAFQNSFENYLLPWIADHDDQFGLGTSAKKVKKVYEARRAALAASPLTLVGGKKLTAAGYDSGIVGGLYWTGLYEDVATAMAVIERYPTATAAQKKLVADVFGSSAALGADAFWAVSCQDDKSPSYRQVLADTARFRGKYPLTGANWNVFPCSFWPRQGKGTPARAGGLPNLLLINNDADPATPLANARASREASDGSVLITVEDQPDHTIYSRGDDCVETFVNDWLIDGDLPDGDQTCPGLPLPEPGQDGAGSGSGSGATRPPAGLWTGRFVAARAGVR